MPQLTLIVEVVTYYDMQSISQSQKTFLKSMRLVSIHFLPEAIFWHHPSVQCGILQVEVLRASIVERHVLQGRNQVRAVR